jgi:hypothetical protein
VGSVQSRLTDGLAVLATVGSTAPFVGLFGTVWGIYNALVKIGISGQASIDKVAGPVGESLIMTAIGLAVAVPAVMGYNWLIRRNKAVMDQTRPSAPTCTTCSSPASGDPPPKRLRRLPPRGAPPAARQSRFRGGCLQPWARISGVIAWR